MKTWNLSPVALGKTVIYTMVLDGVIVGVSGFVGSGVALPCRFVGLYLCLIRKQN